MTKKEISFSGMTPGIKYNQKALLLDMKDNTAKNGSDYVRLTLSDGRETIHAYMFDTKTDALLSMGIACENIVDICLRLNEANSYYKIFMIKKDDYIPEDGMAPKISDDPEELYNYIISSINRAASPPTCGYHSISELAISILEENRDLFTYTAAGKSIHHNLIGGLVQHSARVVKLANCVCDTYPSLDRELLVVGAALHDIGKVSELKTSQAGITSYTVDGSLFGHSLIGFTIIYQKNLEMPCDPERVRLLEHMIAAHHGSKKTGAIAEPATTEAMVLHMLDSLDCRQDQYEQAVQNSIPGKVSGTKMGSITRFIYRPPLLSVHKVPAPSPDTCYSEAEAYDNYYEYDEKFAG